MSTISNASAYDNGLVRFDDLPAKEHFGRLCPYDDSSFILFEEFEQKER
jgi:hypothetical protein